MRRPFDYINGKKIDVNNTEHQKVVIQRNKKLASFSNKKFFIEELPIKVDFTATVPCLKCGAEIKESVTLFPEDLDDTILDHLISFKCFCGLSYERLVLNNSWVLKNPTVKKLTPKS